MINNVVSEKQPNTSLMNAALHGNLAICELLVANGADINVKSHHGFTVLEMVESAPFFNFQREVDAYLRSRPSRNIIQVLA
jgi:ankyrin repeat protein